MLIPSIRSRVKSLDPNLPIYQIAALEKIVAGSIAQPRFNMLLLLVFALMALLLAAIGIYGVLSYSVTQRKKEIGIRMAVGARPRNVLLMVVRQSMLLAGAGMVAGVAASLILSRFMQSLLFRTEPVDPALYAGTAAVAMLAALFASSIPAKRAATLDPLRVLRDE
jgi:putative ABC transport system permease protein